jgi:mono/diheme cytochrome c family protein
LKIARWAAAGWVLPLAVGLPFALFWFFAAAAGATVPVAETLGAASPSLADMIAALFKGAASGHPIVQLALRVAVSGATAAFLLAIALTLVRARIAVRVLAVAAMVAALAAVGGAEWVREGLRKPYVIGSQMFVNGIRLPPPGGSAVAGAAAEDDYRIDRLFERGVLASARFTSLPEEIRTAAGRSAEDEARAGKEVFRLLCSQCHTVDGYLAIRPLVAGKSAGSIQGTLDRLAIAHDASGAPTGWSSARVKLVTWRNRAMPPFVGTDREERALAVYLATLGGGSTAPPIPPVSATLADGAAIFEGSCAMCHGEGTEWPIAARVAGKSEAELFELIGRLPEVNEMMPPFDGTEAERHALATHLAALGAAGGN